MTREEIISNKKDLGWANLRGADLYRADLSEAYLRDAYLSMANLYGANLSGANLSGANLYGANLSGANLSGANLYAASLNGANLHAANLSGANLARVNLRWVDLQGAKGIIRISGSNHEVLATSKGIWVGCCEFSYKTWKEEFQKVGKYHSYTENQIEEYRLYLELCTERFGRLTEQR